MMTHIIHKSILMSHSTNCFPSCNTLTTRMRTRTRLNDIYGKIRFELPLIHILTYQEMQPFLYTCDPRLVKISFLCHCLTQEPNFSRCYEYTVRKIDEGLHRISTMSVLQFMQDCSKTIQFIIAILDIALGQGPHLNYEGQGSR